jgi:hypothetical protein
MNESESSPTRRKRRSEKDLEIDMMKALESLIEENGFMNIRLTVLFKKAEIDPNIFYRKYGTIDKLYDDFVSKYDFWLSNTFKTSQARAFGDDKELYADALKSVLTGLLENKVMQKLLIWELAEDNGITRKTSNRREVLNSGLMTFFETKFASSGININALTAWLVGGIYYVVLHGNRSTLCSVDFSTEDGLAQLREAIDTLVDMLFDKLEQREKLKAIIKRMEGDGIPQKKVCEYLGITVREYRKI